MAFNCSPRNLTQVTSAVTPVFPGYNTAEKTDNTAENTENTAENTVENTSAMIMYIYMYIILRVIRIILRRIRPHLRRIQRIIHLQRFRIIQISTMGWRRVIDSLK